MQLGLLPAQIQAF